VRAVALLAVPLLLCTVAAADEIRLKDGEILFGTIESREKGKLTVRQGSQTRRLREADVAETLQGEDPYRRIAEREAALAPDDHGALSILARYAWDRRLDDEAWRLADAALAVTPSPSAHAWLPDASSDNLTIDGQPVAVWIAVRRGREPWRHRWGRARRRALSKGGGNSATETAIKRALDWLAAHQDEDGKLDADGFMRHDRDGDRCDGAGGGHHGERVPCPFDGATTAVALMAWLASGSTPASGPYRENVVRASTWCGYVLDRTPASGYALWNYGLCTQAMADLYAVTRGAAGTEERLKRAVLAICRLQRADGGWSYYMPIGDVPTTGIAASALALAGRARIPVPGTAVDRAIAFLDARVDPKSGRSEYHEGAERKGYTPTRANAATALTVRALFGRLEKAPGLGKQIAAIQQKPVWKLEFKQVKTRDGRKVRAQIGNLYPYLWYYTTMAMYERGGSSWSTWFGGLKKALLEGQRKDGSAAGSWDPKGQYSSSAGRVFVTGLCALMLQTPYRYPRSR
jgi:hypothetical protein